MDSALKQRIAMFFVIFDNSLAFKRERSFELAMDRIILERKEENRREKRWKWNGKRKMIEVG